MIDYYEELSLVKESDIKDIQEELVRLESLWHKREVNSPEKANKMLGFIMDAQKVFASEALRRKYDRDLENDKKELEDPNVSRSKSLEKWTTQARMFFSDGQYDLAKASIDRALTYVDSEFNSGDLFQLAASIYLENDDMRLSLECINKAIITSPDWANYYIVKARIYERMSLADQQYEKRQNEVNECRNNLMLAVSKAKACDDVVIEGDALGMLAFSLYFHSNPDVVLAEEYAKRAEALGEYANSKRVLDDIAEKKNLPIYNEAKKEEGYGNLQHLREALKLYESIGDWRDASERAAVCRARIRQLEEEEVSRQQEEQRQREEQARKAKEEDERRKRQAQVELDAQRKKKEKTRKTLRKGMVLAVVFMIISGIALVARHHKCGENIRWSFARDTGVLTLEGMGEMYDYQYGGSQPWDGFTDDILTVRIKEGITSVGDYSFYYCRNLTAIELCDTIEVIGEGAFEGCSFDEIVLPKSLLSIEDDAFGYCKLKSIYIPSSVKNIGEVFTFTTELELIITDDENPNFISVDGVLFNKDMTVLLRYPPAKEGNEYRVPYSVNTIYDSAFESAENLERVYLPETLNNMGCRAFYHCLNLIDINIPRNVDRISMQAFCFCGFTSIEIPGNILVVESGAYSDCENLSKVNICDGVKSIGHGAFQFCEKLSNIAVPKSVDYIGSQAFRYCMKDCTIDYSGSIDDWHSIDTNDDYLSYTVKCFDGEL